MKVFFGLGALIKLIVQLGPRESLSPGTKFQFGPKLNTKVAFNTHPPPPTKTFKAVPGKLEA
jgi:hypothetical protein